MSGITKLFVRGCQSLISRKPVCVARVSLVGEATALLSFVVASAGNGCLIVWGPITGDSRGSQVVRSPCLAREAVGSCFAIRSPPPQFPCRVFLVVVCGLHGVAAVAHLSQFSFGWFCL